MAWPWFVPFPNSKYMLSMDSEVNSHLSFIDYTGWGMKPNMLGYIVVKIPDAMCINFLNHPISWRLLGREWICSGLSVFTIWSMNLPVMTLELGLPNLRFSLCCYGNHKTLLLARKPRLSQSDYGSRARNLNTTGGPADNLTGRVCADVVVGQISEDESSRRSRYCTARQVWTPQQVGVLCQRPCVGVHDARRRRVIHTPWESRALTDRYLTCFCINQAW